MVERAKKYFFGLQPSYIFVFLFELNPYYNLIIYR